MMRLSDQYKDLPVLSIHAGHVIARVVDFLIDPHSLAVVGFYCQAPASKKTSILLTQTIREVSREGVVVNHEEDLSEPDDLVRLKDMMDIKFGLIDKSVITESKKKLGKVQDFVVDELNWQIVKLHVQRPSWRAVLNSNLIIDRGMIVSVSRRNVVVKDATIKVTEAAPAAVPTPAT